MDAARDGSCLQRRKAAARKEEDEEEEAEERTENEEADDDDSKGIGRMEAGDAGVGDMEDDQEANADLSLGILAKLNSRASSLPFPLASYLQSSSSSVAFASSPSQRHVSEAREQQELGFHARQQKLGFQPLSTGEDFDSPEDKEMPEEGQILNDEDVFFTVGVSGPLDNNLLENEKKKKKKKKKKNGSCLIPAKISPASENLEIGPAQASTPDGFKSEDAKIPIDNRTLLEAKTTEAATSIVMRKLLRGPRYFDPPEEREKTCYNCGNVGHIAVDCPEQPRTKPCYVCGKFGHEGRECPQSLECYICGKGGHFAKACPEKGKMGVAQQDEAICLHCGDIGHDVTICWKDYNMEDLKAIKCYVCKHYGHLCCVDVVATSRTEVSCYNCGEMGHSGMGCAKSRGHSKNGEKAAQVCFKCGEEGHFARGCNRRDQGFDEDPFEREEGELPQWTQTPSGLLNMGTTPKQVIHWSSDYAFEAHTFTGGSHSRKKGRKSDQQESFIRNNNSQPYKSRRFCEETPHETSFSLPRWFAMDKKSSEPGGLVNNRYSNKSWRT